MRQDSHICLYGSVDRIDTAEMVEARSIEGEPTFIGERKTATIIEFGTRNAMLEVNIGEDNMCDVKVGDRVTVTITPDHREFKDDTSKVTQAPADKIMSGLQDAVDYAKGDTTKGVRHDVYVNPPIDGTCPHGQPGTHNCPATNDCYIIMVGYVAGDEEATGYAVIRADTFYDASQERIIDIEKDMGDMFNGGDERVDTYDDWQSAVKAVLETDGIIVDVVPVAAEAN